MTQVGLLEDLLHEKAWDFEKFRQAAPMSDIDIPHEELQKIRESNAIDDEQRWFNDKSKRDQQEIRKIVKSQKSREW